MKDVDIRTFFPPKKSKEKEEEEEDEEKAAMKKEDNGEGRSLIINAASSSSGAAAPASATTTVVGDVVVAVAVVTPPPASQQQQPFQSQSSFSSSSATTCASATTAPPLPLPPPPPAAKRSLNFCNGDSNGDGDSDKKKQKLKLNPWSGSTSAPPPPLAAAAAPPAAVAVGGRAAVVPTFSALTFSSASASASGSGSGSLPASAPDSASASPSVTVTTTKRKDPPPPLSSLISTTTTTTKMQKQTEQRADRNTEQQLQLQHNADNCRYRLLPNSNSNSSSPSSSSSTAVTSSTNEDEEADLEENEIVKKKKKEKEDDDDDDEKEDDEDDDDDDFDQRLRSHLWFVRQRDQIMTVTTTVTGVTVHDNKQLRQQKKKQQRPGQEQEPEHLHHQIEHRQISDDDDDDDVVPLPPAVNDSERQRRIADHPPDVPLSVRAGAGTGKTHTMVKRAVRLTELHGVDPSKILMLTFTKKASKEMKDRIQQEFIKSTATIRGGGGGGGSQSQSAPAPNVTIINLRLPTVKTFHSLAFQWIRSFWKECGLRCYPSLIVSTNEKKNFMKQVMSTLVVENQLKRCNEYLQLDHKNSSWDKVVNVMKHQHPCLYEQAAQRCLAVEEAKAKSTSMTNKTTAEKVTREDDTTSTQPTKTPTKKKKKKTSTDELLRLKECRRQCYLQLLQQRKPRRSSDRTSSVCRCDLERKWDHTSNDQVKMYLELVDKSRLGRHSPDEYLPNDGDILRRFDEMQYETGKIDFDVMLQLFVDLLKSNQRVRDEFNSLYNYVIVDEYQDNSEVQSELLLQIVQNGRVTVVGDDDQCIYEFRGASPGNFDRFASHFLQEDEGRTETASSSRVAELTLEDNYRSSGNIIKVGNAFLDGSKRRCRKSLVPTKPDGRPVEIWRSTTPLDQASQMATSMKKRHDEDGIPWHEMSCLFRNFRMGAQPVLHGVLGVELAKRNIPFKIAGGETFLESACVMDVVAYLRLSLAGHPIRMDDESFMRILNKPPRKIGKKFEELIEAKRNMMQEGKEDNSELASKIYQPIPVSLEEAARVLCYEETTVLTKQQKTAITGFFELLHMIRRAAITMKLSGFILFVWKNTGLRDMYQKKFEKEQNKESNGSGKTNNQVKNISTYIKALCAVAESHVKEVLSMRSKDESNVPSLQELTWKSVVDNADKVDGDNLPQVLLPPHFIDYLESSDGRGLSVLNSFLTDISLQMSPDNTTEEEGDGPREDDRVVISTIHRSKGLEWQDVYIPYFNERYMPNAYRDPSDDGRPNKPDRHWPDCASRVVGGRCDKQCMEFYAKQDLKKHHNISPEDRQSDEERRLAHVAATRAKDRLVFISTQQDGTRSDLERSPFESAILRTGSVGPTMPPSRSSHLLQRPFPPRRVLFGNR